jgi:glycosyltransferase involved in cell wall biosynthesis
MDTLTRAGTVEHVYAFIDSRYSIGDINITNDFTLKVIPNINEVLDYVEFGDIVWVRGGFKSWLSVLRKLRDRRENWILFYRANTNRGGWPFWDIVLNDLISRPKKARSRLHIPYTKPVNEYVFRAIIPSRIKYDIMIGASHIHGRKGQFRAVEALMRYEQKYGRRLSAVLPGGWIRSRHNDRIHELVSKKRVDVDLIGHKRRGCLAKIMNTCSLFVHAGPGGQNDRGVLEALRCGIPAVIKDPKRYTPALMNDTRYVTVCNSDKVDDWVEAIHVALMKPAAWESFDLYRRELAMWYNNNNGLYTVALPKLDTLIRDLKRCDPREGL